MENLGPGVLKLTHVAIAFAFTAGVAGRWIVLRRAAHSSTIDDTFLLSEAAAPFDRIVILSSMLILPAGFATAWAQGYPWLGLTTGWMSVSVVIYVALSALVPTVFVPRGKVFAAALAGARESGVITPALRAAFSDPLVKFAHIAEAGGLAAIVALMVLKPF